VLKKVFGVIFPLLLVLLLLVPGCRVGSSPLSEEVVIPVTATKNFGNEMIFQRKVVIERRLTAQDVLAEVTDIQMDGSYVVEFVGLRGDDKEYWMYYINGLLSRYFASGYLIRPGDVMHWDFHPWTGGKHGCSAIIGSFPEPLLHGYEGNIKPTLVVYNASFLEEANRIGSLLKKLGVAEVSLKEESSVGSQEKGNSNIVLIAWPDSPSVIELNEEANPLGLYAHFNGSSLVVTDYKFTAMQEYGAGTGVIQACQNLWNPLGTGACQNAIFMVSGTDIDGAKKAASVLLQCTEDILAGRTSAIDGSFGIIITNKGEIIKTPL